MPRYNYHKVKLTSAIKLIGKLLKKEMMQKPNPQKGSENKENLRKVTVNFTISYFIRVVCL